jgi:hypothetical protein
MMQPNANCYHIEDIPIEVVLWILKSQEQGVHKHRNSYYSWTYGTLLEFTDHAFLNDINSLELYIESYMNKWNETDLLFIPRLIRPDSLSVEIFIYKLAKRI